MRLLPMMVMVLGIGLVLTQAQAEEKTSEKQPTPERKVEKEQPKAVKVEGKKEKKDDQLKKNRTTANGSKLTAKTSIATYKVWCYTSGQNALKGYTGVKDIVKLIRRRPFAEWVVVYYDHEKVDSAKLLKQLRAKGCKKATRTTSTSIEKSGVKVSANNPVGAAGDVMQCIVQFPEGEFGKVRVAPPASWKPLPQDVPASNGRIVIDVQSPANARAGKYNLVIKVHPGKKNELSFSVPVELVGLVGKRKG